jgi:hypothetical protein
MYVVRACEVRFVRCIDYRGLQNCDGFAVFVIARTTQCDVATREACAPSRLH